MSKIGNFGKLIVFEVSDKKILTFSNFKREVSSRWTLHQPINSKPIPEFIGMGQDNISMTITISALHGIKPRKVIERLERAVKKGKVETLVIGGKVVGKGKYYISKISESWDCIYKKGELFQATLNIYFEEY